MNVLGIDPGLTKPGFYTGGTAYSYDMKDLDQFEALAYLDEWVEHMLMELAKAGEDILVACENPVKPRFGSGVKTLLAQGAVRLTTKRVAMTRIHVPVRWVDIPPSSLKKFATGSGNASKAEVLWAAKKVGALVTTEDEADADWCWRIGQLYTEEPGAVVDIGALGIRDVTTVMPELQEV